MTNDKSIVPSAADPNETVEDEAKASAFNIAVGGGMEFRRGKGRLQGIYGPMASIYLGSSVTENVYGNDASANFLVQGRSNEVINGDAFGLSLGCFASVECFFTPKTSLCAKI